LGAHNWSEGSKVSKFNIKRERVRPLTSESKAEYLAEEKRFFGATGDVAGRGLSASDAVVADRHLPSKQQEQKMLDRWEWGLTKASRSGAFSKPGSGPAIFPGGLKKTMDFIDECTPGQYKEQQERPVPKEQTRKVDVPPAAVTLTHMCVDCLGPVDQNDAANIVPAIFFMTTQNTTKLFSMGVSFGDIVLAVCHLKCSKEAQTQAKGQTGLILVREGEISDPDEMAKAAAYGRIHRMHSGHELTMGQWYLQKRKDRLQQQIEDILICMDKTSEAYRKNRKDIE
jgi:hypothetical protein